MVAGCATDNTSAMLHHKALAGEVNLHQMLAPKGQKKNSRPQAGALQQGARAKLMHAHNLASVAAAALSAVRPSKSA